MNQDQQPWQPTNQPPVPAPSPAPMPLYSPNPPDQPMSPLYSQPTSIPVAPSLQQNPQPTPPFEMQSQPMQPVQQPIPPASAYGVPTATLVTATPQISKPTGVPLFIWIIFIVVTLGVAGLATAVILMK